MSPLSFHVDDLDSKNIRDYAKLEHTAVLDVRRNSINEKIEDECDRENFDRVLARLETRHSLDDVKKKLNL